MILSVPSVVCLEWSLSQCKHLLLHFIMVCGRFVSGRHWLLPETYSRNLVLTYNAYPDFEQTFSKACSSVSWPRKCVEKDFSVDSNIMWLSARKHTLQHELCKIRSERWWCKQDSNLGFRKTLRDRK